MFDLKNEKESSSILIEILQSFYEKVHFVVDCIFSKIKKKKKMLNLKTKMHNSGFPGIYHKIAFRFIHSL